MLQRPLITCNITVSLLEISLYLNNNSGIQLSTVVFHILLRRIPLQKRVTLRKIGHVGRQPIRFFPHGHSAKYFTHYAIPQSINSLWWHCEHGCIYWFVGGLSPQRPRPKVDGIRVLVETRNFLGTIDIMVIAKK